MGIFAYHHPGIVRQYHPAVILLVSVCLFVSYKHHMVIGFVAFSVLCVSCVCDLKEAK